MNRPMLTAAIPAYNCAGTIGRAIDSVLAQTYQDFELLVVDDCSTDGTLDKIGEYGDGRIRVERHAKNLGEAGSRNTLFAKAGGKYLAFLDSDDEWYPKKLENQVAFLEDAGERMTACFCGYEVREVETGRTMENYVEPQKVWVKFFLRTCDLAPGTTMMIPVDVFKKVGRYDLGLQRRTDHDWLLRFAKAGGHCHIIEGIHAVVYSESGKAIAGGETSLDLFYRKHRADYRRYGWWFTRKTIAEQLVRMSKVYARNNDGIHCVTAAIKAACYDPSLILMRPLKALDGLLGAPLARIKRHFRDRTGVTRR